MVNTIGKQSQDEVRESALDPRNDVDENGKPIRTGTMWTASAHIITTMVGAGVLALAWGMAQLGWIVGIAVVLVISIITIYTYNLLADCYRYPDPITGHRTGTYMHAVKAYLGWKMHVACGLVQYVQLAGVAIGYTITTSTSMVAIQKSQCFHQRGHKAHCRFSNNLYMLGFGILQIFLSQLQNLHKLTWISIVAALCSFGYAIIGTVLSILVVAQGKGQKTRLTGIPVGPDLSATDKVWNIFSALGNIALACEYSNVLVDIEDTLKSDPPESIEMKKANYIGISTMVLLFLMCGCFGYAAFGDLTPGNILTGFGFYDPFWLVDWGNLFIVIHLIGAYQVSVQPVYRIVELGVSIKWPKSKFINKDYPVRIGNLSFNTNSFRLIWRTLFVALVTTLSMAMPFFNEILSLLGALGFWPLGVFFPVQMHIAQKHIKKLSFKWIMLQLLSFGCFLFSLVAAVGAIHGICKNLSIYKPFMYKQ